jgi:thiamine pyrophosphate-dependent acetolactate synthase large subunit-like protein
MDRNKNFYVQGSMGAALPIGIGVALCRPKEKVIVIAGDGEILMGLSTLILLKKLQDKNKIDNLELYILDNNKYQSTGGQKTVSDAIDFRCLCYCKVIFVSDSSKEVPRINIPHYKIKRRFMNAI